MASLPKVRPFTQRKQLPDVEATGTLCCGTDRIHDLLNEAAVLTIHSPTGAGLYWLGCDTDGEGRIVALRLRKFGSGELYKIAIDGDRFECSCADCTFRQRRCKHIAGVAHALTHPEE
jgi:hypothetical protein